MQTNVYTLSARNEIVELANSLDAGEVVYYEPPSLDLKSLICNMI